MKRIVLALVVGCVIAPAQPSVNPGGILNVASYAPPGLPNASIAQGSLFAIFGTGLGPSTGVQVSSFPLTPDGFQGTSVSVTVAGNTLKAPVLYTSANQVNAMLPSATGVGSGTLTVSYNGRTSSPVAIAVTANSFGNFAVNQAGSGPGVITNANYQALNFTNAANPGEPMILWGTGLGPVTGDENAGPLPGNMPSLPVKLYVGNQQATITYQGRSGCCSGVDQITFTVPSNVTGCAVPVAVQIGGTVSNFVTMPIASSGRVCSDSSVFSSTLLAQLSTKGSVAIGGVSLLRETGTTSGMPMTADSAGGSFARYSFSNFEQYLAYLPVQTVGACSVLTFKGSDVTEGPTVASTALDAGNALTLNGPGGTTAQLMLISQGNYDSAIGGGSSGKPLFFTAGSYTALGPGGADVGAFQATVQFAANFAWTNQNSITAVTRSQGVTVSWTGADAANGIYVTGFSAGGSDPNNLIAGSFSCHAAGASGSFTVPAYVLLALPPSYTVPGLSLPTGSLGVSSGTSYQTFSAPGLDLGFIGSSVEISQAVTYE